MPFRVILFQPSVKYRWNYFVGDVTTEVVYAVIFYQLSRIYRQLSLLVTLSIIIKKYIFFKNLLNKKNN